VTWWVKKRFEGPCFLHFHYTASQPRSPRDKGTNAQYELGVNKRRGKSWDTRLPGPQSNH